MQNRFDECLRPSISPAEILELAILDAVAIESYAPTIEVVQRSPRGYPCAQEGCLNQAQAKGLCNAHYLRAKNGKDMGAPVRNRRSKNTCKECGKISGNSGAWGLCSNHYKARRRRLIRRVAVNFLGGKCSVCSGVFPDVAYDFHHDDPASKTADPSTMIDTYSLASVCAEIAKCSLFCANCHRIEHHG